MAIDNRPIRLKHDLHRRDLLARPTNVCSLGNDVTHLGVRACRPSFFGAGSTAAVGCRWSLASSVATSRAQVAFNFALSPGVRLLQRLALHVADCHLGHEALGIDLHGDLGRGWLRGDR